MWVVFAGDGVHRVLSAAVGKRCRRELLPPLGF